MQQGIPGVGIHRIDLRTGRRHDLFQPTFVTSLAGEACPGVNLVEGRAEPGEVPEGFLPNHALAVNLGGPTACEAWRPGLGWKAAVTPPHGVHLVPALMPYAARWRQPIRVLLLDIAPAFVAAATGEVAPPSLDLYPAGASNDPVAAHAALAIAEEMRAGAPGGRLCAESLATALVVHLLPTRSDAGPRNARRPASLSKPRLDRVLEYVSERLAQSISLRDLAALADMDVFGFVRAFKEATGLPPHQYVLRARVERAKVLLRDHRLSVSDVALATGFATPSHFATTFRRLTRATPRAFRDSLA